MLDIAFRTDHRKLWELCRDLFPMVMSLVPHIPYSPCNAVAQPNTPLCTLLDAQNGSRCDLGNNSEDINPVLLKYLTYVEARKIWLSWNWRKRCLRSEVDGSILLKTTRINQIDFSVLLISLWECVLGLRVDKRSQVCVKEVFCVRAREHGRACVRTHALVKCACVCVCVLF